MRYPYFLTAFFRAWYQLGAVALLLLARPAVAYSVLTHQANVDSCWARSLRPALEERFPGATAAELLSAKAYAYGGSIIQDMGYFPFGSALFTNLTHYVRSGDFVRNLLTLAATREEYAFALGALSHYAADVEGHGSGTNRAVPIIFPELAAKFGPVVTYLEAPLAHSRAEFAFDVVQLAAGHYRTTAYQSFVGFRVQKDVLARAFRQTYGLELSEVVLNVDLSVASYRFAVRRLIPAVSRAAWRANRHQIRREVPGVQRREMVYRVSRSAYHQQFGTDYERPGVRARILTGVLQVLPKVGPLRALRFVTPPAEAQRVYRASFARTVRRYGELLHSQVRGGQMLSGASLPNTDFDTGHPTRLGEYALADQTYGEWLRKLDKEDFKRLSEPMKQNLLDFFTQTTNAPVDAEEREHDNLRHTQAALARLRAR
jgi:hypothetical protein